MCCLSALTSDIKEVFHSSLPAVWANAAVFLVFILADLTVDPLLSLYQLDTVPYHVPFLMTCTREGPSEVLNPDKLIVHQYRT